MLCNQILFGLSKKGERDGRGTWHEWGRGEIQTGFWWGSVKDKGYLENIDVMGRIILK
jgi:hypothetical protein